MDRALPRLELPSRTLVLSALVAASAILSVPVIVGLQGVPFDWAIFAEASHRYFDGDLYGTSGTYAYRYSPVLAPALRVVEWIGPAAWRALHVAAALALPTWPLRLLTLASFPFWFDVDTGNFMVFVLLAAAWAIRGNRWGVLAFFALTLLMPRPLMLPIAGWLLWQRPEWRWPFAAMFTAHALGVLWTGWGDEWVARLVDSSGEMQALNLAPTRWIGWWWMLLAIPVAVWLTIKRRLGWASLLASPYWLPYYLLMPLLDIKPRAAWRGPRESAP